MAGGRLFYGNAWGSTKSIFARITLNRITLIFFLLTLLHAASQTVVQTFLLSLDWKASFVSSAIVRVAQVPSGSFAWLTKPGGGMLFDGMSTPEFELQLCRLVPVAENRDKMPCMTVFQTGQGDMSMPTGFKRSTIPSNTTTLSNSISTNMTAMPFKLGNLMPTYDSNGTISGVEIAQGGNVSVTLNQQCTRVMLYADQVLKNARREEIALIGSEAWMFSLSFFAIIYDSIPHLVAAFILRLLSAGWSSYALWRTQEIDGRFNLLITKGACGINLFPTYFQDKTKVQVVDLVINLVALFALGYPSWELLKSFSMFTFKRVGAPPNLVILHRYFHGVFVCLQLSIFFLIASGSLWVDQLTNGAISAITTDTSAFIGMFVFTCIMLLPWILIGYHSVRLEQRVGMIVHIAAGFILLSMWTIMYYSLIYRWTWIQWPFFACLTVSAQLVIAATVALGIKCWKNFGMGLKHYLHVEQQLSRANFEPEVFPHDVKGPHPSLDELKGKVGDRSSRLEAALSPEGRDVSHYVHASLELRVPKEGFESTVNSHSSMAAVRSMKLRNSESTMGSLDTDPSILEDSV